MDKKELELQSKISELEAKVKELSQVNAKQKVIIDEYKQKEQSISNAIIASMEHANQLEASRKKLYKLDIQRSRYLYLQMEQIVSELYVRYPEVKKDLRLRNMTEKFKSMIYDGFKEKSSDLRQIDGVKEVVVDDPIKKLLRNIIDCFDNNKSIGENSRGGPSDILLNENKKEGFDFNEALHPTMGLDEIMKSFNLNTKKDN